MSGIKKENTIIGLILLGFAAYYGYLSSLLPDRNLPNTLSSDFMPYIFAGALAVLSILLIIEGYVKNCEGASMQRIPPKKVAGIMVLFAVLVGYVFGIIYIGYLIMTPIVLVILLVMGGSRKPLEIILTSVLVTAGVYYLFHIIFRVPL